MGLITVRLTNISSRDGWLLVTNAQSIFLLYLTDKEPDSDQVSSKEKYKDLIAKN